MTGYFVRVHRGGQWQNADIAELSDEELEALPINGELARHQMIALARWIRDNVHAKAPHEQDTQEDEPAPARGKAPAR